MLNALQKWLIRLKLQRITTIGIIVTLTLSASIIGVTIYSQNVGNFIISIEDETKLGLVLSEDAAFSSPTGMLNAKGLDDITNATLNNIPLDISSGEGNCNDLVNHRYFAYNFFLRNASSLAVDYTLRVTINQVTKNLDAALRVMIISDGSQRIYAKPKADGTPEDYPYLSTNFLSQSAVCQESVKNLRSDEVKKYTIVLWLEGWDEQCIDDIKGGTIRMTMQFNATQAVA